MGEENRQQFIIPLSSDLDVKSNDMFVPLTAPKFLHNRQQFQGGVLTNSYRFERNGWAIGDYVVEFEVETEGIRRPFGDPLFEMVAFKNIRGYYDCAIEGGEDFDLEVLQFKWQKEDEIKTRGIEFGERAAEFNARGNFEQRLEVFGLPFGGIESSNVTIEMFPDMSVEYTGTKDIGVTGAFDMDTLEFDLLLYDNRTHVDVDLTLNYKSEVVCTSSDNTEEYSRQKLTLFDGTTYSFGDKISVTKRDSSYLASFGTKTLDFTILQSNPNEFIINSAQNAIKMRYQNTLVTSLVLKTFVWDVDYSTVNIAGITNGNNIVQESSTFVNFNKFGFSTEPTTYDIGVPTFIIDESLTRRLTSANGLNARLSGMDGIQRDLFLAAPRRPTMNLRKKKGRYAHLFNHDDEARVLSLPDGEYTRERAVSSYALPSSDFGYDYRTTQAMNVKMTLPIWLGFARSSLATTRKKAAYDYDAQAQDKMDYSRAPFNIHFRYLYSMLIQKTNAHKSTASGPIDRIKNFNGKANRNYDYYIVARVNIMSFVNALKDSAYVVDLYRAMDQAISCDDILSLVTGGGSQYDDIRRKLTDVASVEFTPPNDPITNPGKNADTHYAESRIKIRFRNNNSFVKKLVLPVLFINKFTLSYNVKSVQGDTYCSNDRGSYKAALPRDSSASLYCSMSPLVMRLFGDTWLHDMGVEDGPLDQHVSRVWSHESNDKSEFSRYYAMFAEGEQEAARGTWPGVNDAEGEEGEDEDISYKFSEVLIEDGSEGDDESRSELNVLLEREWQRERKEGYQKVRAKAIAELLAGFERDGESSGEDEDEEEVPEPVNTRIVQSFDDFSGEALDYYTADKFAKCAILMKGKVTTPVDIKAYINVDVGDFENLDLTKDTFSAIDKGSVSADSDTITDRVLPRPSISVNSSGVLSIVNPMGDYGVIRYVVLTDKEFDDDIRAEIVPTEDSPVYDDNKRPVLSSIDTAVRAILYDPTGVFKNSLVAEYLRTDHAAGILDDTLVATIERFQKEYSDLTLREHRAGGISWDCSSCVTFAYIKFQSDYVHKYRKSDGTLLETGLPTKIYVQYIEPGTNEYSFKVCNSGETITIPCVEDPIPFSSKYSGGASGGKMYFTDINKDIDKYNINLQVYAFVNDRLKGRTAEFHFSGIVAPSSDYAVKEAFYAAGNLKGKQPIKLIDNKFFKVSEGPADFSAYEKAFEINILSVTFGTQANGRLVIYECYSDLTRRSDLDYTYSREDESEPNKVYGSDKAAPGVVHVYEATSVERHIRVRVDVGLEYKLRRFKNTDIDGVVSDVFLAVFKDEIDEFYKAVKGHDVTVRYTVNNKMLSVEETFDRLISDNLNPESRFYTYFILDINLGNTVVRSSGMVFNLGLQFVSESDDYTEKGASKPSIGVYSGVWEYGMDTYTQSLNPGNDIDATMGWELEHKNSYDSITANEAVATNMAQTSKCYGFFMQLIKHDDSLWASGVTADTINTKFGGLSNYTGTTTQGTLEDFLSFIKTYKYGTYDLGYKEWYVENDIHNVRQVIVKFEMDVDYAYRAVTYFGMVEDELAALAESESTAMPGYVSEMEGSIYPDSVMSCKGDEGSALSINNSYRKNMTDPSGWSVSTIGTAAPGNLNPPSGTTSNKRVVPSDWSTALVIKSGFLIEIKWRLSTKSSWNTNRYIVRPNSITIHPTRTMGRFKYNFEINIGKLTDILKLGSSFEYQFEGTVKSLDLTDYTNRANPGYLTASNRKPPENVFDIPTWRFNQLIGTVTYTKTIEFEKKDEDEEQPAPSYLNVRSLAYGYGATPIYEVKLKGSIKTGGARNDFFGVLSDEELDATLYENNVSLQKYEPLNLIYNKTQTGTEPPHFGQQGVYDDPFVYTLMKPGIRPKRSTADLSKAVVEFTNFDQPLCSGLKYSIVRGLYYVVFKEPYQTWVNSDGEMVGEEIEIELGDEIEVTAESDIIGNNIRIASNSNSMTVTNIPVATLRSVKIRIPFCSDNLAPVNYTEANEPFVERLGYYINDKYYISGNTKLTFYVAAQNHTEKQGGEEVYYYTAFDLKNRFDPDAQNPTSKKMIGVLDIENLKKYLESVNEERVLGTAIMDYVDYDGTVHKNVPVTMYAAEAKVTDEIQNFTVLGLSLDNGSFINICNQLKRKLSATYPASYKGIVNIDISNEFCSKMMAQVAGVLYYDLERICKLWVPHYSPEKDRPMNLSSIRNMKNTDNLPDNQHVCDVQVDAGYIDAAANYIYGMCLQQNSSNYDAIDQVSFYIIPTSNYRDEGSEDGIKLPISIPLFAKKVNDNGVEVAWSSIEMKDLVPTMYTTRLSSDLKTQEGITTVQLAKEYSELPRDVLAVLSASANVDKIYYESTYEKSVALDKYYDIADYFGHPVVKEMQDNQYMMTTRDPDYISELFSVTPPHSIYTFKSPVLMYSSENKFPMQQWNLWKSADYTNRDDELLYFIYNCLKCSLESAPVYPSTGYFDSLNQNGLEIILDKENLHTASIAQAFGKNLYCNFHFTYPSMSLSFGRQNYSGEVSSFDGVSNLYKINKEQARIAVDMYSASMSVSNNGLDLYFKDGLEIEKTAENIHFAGTGYDSMSFVTALRGIYCEDLPEDDYSELITGYRITHETVDEEVEVEDHVVDYAGIEFSLLEAAELSTMTMEVTDHDVNRSGDE